MYRYGYHMMAPAFPFYGLISLIFWALIISLIVGILVRMFDNRSEAEENKNELENSDDALEILRKRYAKGEITKKEFLEMKKDIA